MEDFHRNNFIVVVDNTLSSMLKGIIPLAIMFFFEKFTGNKYFSKISYFARDIFTHSNLPNN